VTLKQIVQEATIQAGLPREMKTKIVGHSTVWSPDTGELRCVLIRFDYTHNGTRYIRERLAIAKRERVISLQLVFANHWKV
jgi:hypothetical protein